MNAGFEASRATEAVSPLTAAIDTLSTLDALSAFGANDALLFLGLRDASLLESAARVAAWVRGAVAHPRGRVVFAGAGTSGRLAHFHARALNAAVAAAGCQRAPFSYILAGGDAALVLPVESAEDSPAAARAAFAEWDARTGGADAGPTVLLGISCGLSAAFVFTLVGEALPLSHFQVAVLGFNAADASPFAAELAALIQSGGELLNPRLGAESVAGSSRLKGGSATSIIVTAIAVAALSPSLVEGGGGCSSVGAGAAGCGSDAPLPSGSGRTLLTACFTEFEAALTAVYASPTHCAGLAALADAAGEALCTRVPTSATGRGRILYIGVGAAGALALVDASECPPTFGALFDDVRAWVGGGWRHILGDGVPLPSVHIPQHLLGSDSATINGGVAASVDVDLPSFHTRTLCTLSKADLVILVAVEGDETTVGGAAAGEDGMSPSLKEALEALEAAARAGARVAHLLVLTNTSGSDVASVASPPSLLEAKVTALAPLGAILRLERLRPLCHGEAAAGGAFEPPPALAQLALKLGLNATSTLSHVSRGCVVGGRMIGMAVTNKKLLVRAAGIIAGAACVGSDAAWQALLRVIHDKEGGDALPPSLSPEEHVAVACTQRDTLPVAIVLAALCKGVKDGGGGGTPTVALARSLLQQHPNPRRAIAAALCSTV